jgi:2-polyprenyl-6-methoxyphenol hydroxylase-like FAD-dependent oxidoreductase
VALLGDAAHPTTPNLGQGGCQAIEDAVALSGALATWANPATAFEAYERVRVVRANKLVEDARRFGALAHSVNPAFLFVREALLKWTPHALVRRNFQSIFRYEDPFKDARCARTPL